MPILTPTFVVDKQRNYTTISNVRHAIASVTPNNNASYGVGLHAVAECKEDDFHATVEYNQPVQCEACIKVLKERYERLGIPWPG